MQAKFCVLGMLVLLFLFGCGTHSDYTGLPAGPKEAKMQSDAYAVGAVAQGVVYKKEIAPAIAMPEDVDVASEMDVSIPQTTIPHNTEAYDVIVENEFKNVQQEPLSTFSIDVDTASYSNIRRFLQQSSFPPKGAVRIEEMVNYFSYDYKGPTNEDPFGVNIDIAECPWKPEHNLVRIGLKGKVFPQEQKLSFNLVFLIDVSGSMTSSNKLPLVKEALKLLVEQMTERDRIGIVVYASRSGVYMPSTPGDKKEKIISAINSLEPGGSTNAGDGIIEAYNMAIGNFIPDGVNRVILATDGDFNVGTTSDSALHDLITEKAKSKVFLTVLGFGMGNYKDGTLELLADKGNGNYGYIDNINEAKRMLVEQMAGTLVTIAKDVKIQVEFNPKHVLQYRLIGYENRIMNAADFRDDTKDAGEIGEGHTVTAFYELVPVGAKPVELAGIDPLKYQVELHPKTDVPQGEWMTVKLRYKDPHGDTSRQLDFPVLEEQKLLQNSSKDFMFATSVVCFGMLLRDSKYKGGMTIQFVEELAMEAIDENSDEYRKEFLTLLKKAKDLIAQ